MAVSADWRGKEPFGAFGIERVVTLNAADGWLRVDLRDTPFLVRQDVLDLVTAHPRGYTAADIEARGVVRQIDLSALTGTDPAQISMNVVGGLPSPADALQRAEVGGLPIRIVSSTRPERWEFWLRVDNDQTVVNLGIRFDIPDAG